MLYHMESTEIKSWWEMKLDGFRWTAKDSDGYGKSFVLSITVSERYCTLFQMGCARSVNHS